MANLSEIFTMSSWVRAVMILSSGPWVIGRCLHVILQLRHAGLWGRSSTETSQDTALTVYLEHVNICNGIVMRFIIGKLFTEISAWLVEETEVVHLELSSGPSCMVWSLWGLCSLLSPVSSPSPVLWPLFSRLLWWVLKFWKIKRLSKLSTNKTGKNYFLAPKPSLLAEL